MQNDCARGAGYGPKTISLIFFYHLKMALKQSKAARAARRRYALKKGKAKKKVARKKRGAGRAAFGLKGSGVKTAKFKAEVSRMKKKGGFWGALLAAAAPLIGDLISGAISKK